MKWYGISGSWRIGNQQLTNDVRVSVSQIMQNGDGIVSGGALGVDYIATKEALKCNPEADRIKIIIPAPFELFTAHYRKRAGEGVITLEQAESLIELLTVIKQKGSLREMDYTELNEDSYYARNTEVLKESNELLAFQVNGSQGTQDTINKARSLNIPVVLKQYKLAVKCKN